jgi:hypothetical protein
VASGIYETGSGDFVIVGDGGVSVELPRRTLLDFMLVYSEVLWAELIAEVKSGGADVPGAGVLREAGTVRRPREAQGTQARGDWPDGHPGDRGLDQGA